MKDAVTEAASQDPVHALVRYLPASEAERGLTLLHIRCALARVPYLEITSVIVEDGIRDMIRVKVRPKVARTPAATIEADIRTVWEREVAASCTGISRI